MERVSNPVAVTKEEEEEMELPPGFRFHPTDEELITHYLSPKVGDSCFCARAIGEVDLNKCEPWELPWRAKMGEKEWYFFCVRDRKYPTGLRTNRATEAGYWKATGKDKEIYRARALVGMKKTLVFYRGRAPKGEKSNWVMHEYRLEGKYSYNLPSIAKNEWVVCRVFEKTAGGKKVHISGLARLPPLMETSPNRGDTSGESDAAAAAARETPHVTCFSDPMEDQKSRTNLSPSSSSLNPPIPPPSVTSVLSSKISLPPSFYPAQQMPPAIGNLGFPCGNFSADQSILRLLFENYGMKQRERPEFSQDTVLSTDVNTDLTSVVSNHELIGEDLGACGGPVDLDCLWDY